MSRQSTSENDQSPPRTSRLFLSSRYRRSPYFEATQRHGCELYGVYNHMLLPMSYGNDPVDDYWHLLEHVTLWDVGVQRIVQIRGPDAEEFTNTLTPRDVTECSVGQGRYAPLTAEDGGIVNDPVLLRIDEDQFWFSLADSDAGLWIRAHAYRSPFDVEVTEPDIHPVQIQGPKSKPLIDELFGAGIRDLDYYWCAETELDGIPVVVSRTGWSGELGYEVFLRDSTYGDDLWDRIMSTGEKYNIRPTPPAEIRRIEAGIFNYGSDMTLANNPFQLTGMERLVEFESNSDFIGKEVLKRIADEGVNSKLVGVKFDDQIDTRITEHWTAYHEGEAVGRVTAATWSPRLDQGIGYVWVPAELMEKGTSLRLETSERITTEGRVADLPFIDSNK